MTDLENRIEAEQSMLPGEQTLVSLVLAQRQSQEALIAQADRKVGTKAILTNMVHPFGGFK